MDKKRIILDFETFTIEAELFDSPIALRFAEHLSCTVSLQQWGNELYGSIGMDLGEGNPVPKIPPGGIAYTNNGNYLCLIFGQQTAWPVDYIGLMDGDGWKQLTPATTVSTVTVRLQQQTLFTEEIYFSGQLSFR